MNDLWRVSKLVLLPSDLGDVGLLDEENRGYREERICETCDDKGLDHVNNHAPITNRDLLSISDFV